jgi:hypothetical protein
MTFCILGLEVDGVTGQGYLLPFKGVAVPVIGYKGYNTLAARSEYTLSAGVVKEKDEFDFRLGTSGFVDHKPYFGGGGAGRIIGGWSCARHHKRPPIISVMTIDQLLQVKKKAPGASKADSPWNDTAGPGYEAMLSKTVKRRLARDMPLNLFQLGAVVDEAIEERGLPAYLHHDAGGTQAIVGGQEVDKDNPFPDRQPPEEGPNLTAEPVEYRVALRDGRVMKFGTPDQWLAKMEEGLQAIAGAGGSKARLKAFHDRNRQHLMDVRETDPDAASRFAEMYEGFYAKAEEDQP